MNDTITALGKSYKIIKLLGHDYNRLKTAGIRIDYYPTNFVVYNAQLWYVDYECNDYMEEWDFEHWGIKYWSK